MTIVRWEPSRDFGFASGSAWIPPVDVYQASDEELVLKAELPDLAREDIEIKVEKKFAGDVKAEQFHHVERRYGTFSRSFTLPQTVDAARVSADYRNGVLT